MNRIIISLGLILLSSQVFTKPALNKLGPKGRDVEFLKRLDFCPKTQVDEKSCPRIGQVGGLDTDSYGNLLVFHRGSRKWAWDSFFNDNFNQKRYGAIKEDVLSVIGTQGDDRIFNSWGADRFYMPHGLTIDYDENVWLTDVALHQVFKFSQSSEEPELVLGERFEKGNDESHFCKPTSVVVAQLSNDIFVADGYCNRRIVQFDEMGNFIREYEDKDQPMIVVHSIVLMESEQMVCAASREDGRIVCFDIESGDKRYVINDPSMKTVYAIKYDPLNQVIQAATGDNHDLEAYGLTFDVDPISVNFGKLIQKWSHKTEDLAGAHDIAISPQADKIYIGQLNGEVDEFDYHKV